MNFFKNLVGVKTDQAVTGMMSTLVRIDPTAASEAELRTMEQHLDQLGVNVAKARTAFEKEERESQTAQALYNQRLHAAEIISQRAEAEQDPAKKAQLNKSLETLVAQLETTKGTVEREAKESVEAKEFLELLQTRYEEAGAKLKTARSDLEGAQRDMARAGQRREQAEDRAEAARQSAGLAGATSGISTALKAMQDAATKENEKAEAAVSKANLLRPSNPETEDQNIASALAQASGKSEAPVSLSDRLAQLRQA